MIELSFKNDILPLKDVLFRMALRITLNREDAEDIVQEVLIRLWEEGKKKEFENIKAYAITVCRNLSLDHIALKERQHEGFDEDVHVFIDTAQQPDEQIETAERTRWVNNLVNQLPEKQRTAIQLRDIEGHSYKEIADIMEISESDVKVNIFRGRRKIKDILINNHPNR